MTEKTLRKVCECKHCGNEAEMVITCALAPEAEISADARVVPASEGRHTGHAVCSHCGGEADIWLDG